MPVNDTFRTPRRTQKITTTQPVQVIQYAEHVGNLPANKKYANFVPSYAQTTKVIGQAFRATRDSIKAIGLYFKLDYKRAPKDRTGTFEIQLWHWVGYPAPGGLAPVFMENGRLAICEVDLTNAQNMNETMFEFEDYIFPFIGDIYFITIVQNEGYRAEFPVPIATSADQYGDTEFGDFWIWNKVTNLLSRFAPDTDAVFQVYRSITELQVDITGGTGNLTGIQDSLTNPPTEPQGGFSIADYAKPFSSHGQAFIDSANTSGNAPTVTGAHAAFSSAVDLLISMKTAVEGFPNPIFHGSGLNNLTASNSGFNKLGDCYIKIQIYSIGVIDQFKWTVLDVSGYEIATGILPITGGAQAIYAGITVTFATVNGHTSGEYWTMYASDWDTILISTTERIRVEWSGSDATPSAVTAYRLMQSGEMIAIPEFCSKFAFRLHVLGDTPPEISMTLWRSRR